MGAMPKKNSEFAFLFVWIIFFLFLQDVDQFEDRSCVGKTRLYANQLHFYMSSDKLSPCYRRISAFLAYINKFYRVYLISFDAILYAIIC